MASIYKEAGRQGTQLRLVKSIFLRIEFGYRYEVLYGVSEYKRILSPKRKY